MWSASRLANLPPATEESEYPFQQLDDWGASSQNSVTDFCMRDVCTNLYITQVTPYMKTKWKTDLQSPSFICLLLTNNLQTPSSTLWSKANQIFLC